MQIQWFGQSFFKITSKNQQGEEVTLAIDPLGKDYGLKLPNKFGADVLLLTHDHEDHNNVELIKGTDLSKEPFLISGPGEYEVKGAMTYGIPSYHDDQQGMSLGENTIYLMEIEDVWLAHLGDFGQKSLTDEQLEQLQGVDILIVPVGGKYTLGAKDAAEIISQLEPRVIIPMHYKIPGLKVEVGGVEKFIKEIGLKPGESQDKFRVSKKDLPQEETKLVILNP